MTHDPRRHGCAGAVALTATELDAIRGQVRRLGSCPRSMAMLLLDEIDRFRAAAAAGDAPSKTIGPSAAVWYTMAMLCGQPLRSDIQVWAQGVGELEPIEYWDEVSGVVFACRQPGRGFDPGMGSARA